MDTTTSRNYWPDRVLNDFAVMKTSYDSLFDSMMMSNQNTTATARADVHSEDENEDEDDFMGLSNQNLPPADDTPPTPLSNQDLTGDQNLPHDDMVPPLPSNQNATTRAGVHSEDEDVSNQNLPPAADGTVSSNQNLPDDDMVPPSNQNTTTARRVHSEDDFNDGQISISYEGTCPCIILSENLREDITVSWEKSLIVKLLD